MLSRNFLHLLERTHRQHQIVIRKKISKRVPTTKSPCAQYEYKTCQSIEENKMILKQFNCRVELLYFGRHLDELISKETSDCTGNVTKKAIGALLKKTQ